jgi:CRISPR-associated protein Csx17
MQGRDGLADAIAVVERRLILAARKDRRRLPLVAASKAYASLTDLSALIAGEVDLDRTLTLARALMALDLRKWSADPQPPAMPQEHEWPDDAWSLLRLAMLPWPLEDHDIPVDSAMFRRLATGDAGQAVVIATRRLRIAGIVPTIRGASVPSQTARRWAAAMAFPIAPFQAKQLLRRLDPNTITEE